MVCVHWVQYLQTPEEGSDPLKLMLQGVVSLSTWVLGIESGCSDRVYMLLVTDSPQPLFLT